MAAHRWTKAMRARASASQKMRYAQRKTLGKFPDVPLRIENQTQQAQANIPEIERFNYRRGLLDAIDCILREVRHS